MARLGALPACLLAGLLVLSACGSGGSAEPGGNGSTTDASVLGPVAKAVGEPVRIGLISDGKSSITDTTSEGTAAKATVAYLNEHRSGIGGRPIELVTCDALGDPAKAGDCANDMIARKAVAVIIGAVQSQENAWRGLHAAGIPTMLYAAGTSAMINDPENTFVLSHTLFGVLGLPIEVAKRSGAKLVTSVVIDVPPAKALLETNGAAIYRKAGIGYKLLPVPPGTADMTPQMQQVKAAGGDVFILGTDSFCISALQGLRAVGFTGKISTVGQCISDATRKALPGNALKGISVAATAPIGVDNPTTRLYGAVASTYGKSLDTSKTNGLSIFTAFSGLQAGLTGITGDITAARVTAALKAMPSRELPGSGGQQFQCGGKAVPESPAVCVSGGLVTTLDGAGKPTTYEPVRP